MKPPAKQYAHIHCATSFVVAALFALLSACLVVNADDDRPQVPVGEGEVAILSSHDKETRVTAFLSSANGRRLDVPFSAFSDGNKLGQVSRVPSGNVVLNVRIQIGGDPNVGGRLNCWNVNLSGGKRYELTSEGVRVGKLLRIVRVWLVDAESRSPVSEKRAIAVVSGENFTP